MARLSGRVLTGAVLVAVATLVARAPLAAEPEVKPHGTRTLILIRHGAYQEDPETVETSKTLTEAGRQQARLTAARLAALPVKIDAIYTSKLIRARETAALIAETLGAPPPQDDRDLVECLPPSEDPPSTKAEVLAAEDCQRALERDFERYFRPSPERDRTEVIVAHGNVIRVLVSLAVGMDTQCWKRMTIPNCSLTVIRVAAGGAMQLVSYGDVGHLPPSLQSFTSSLPLWGKRASEGAGVK